MSWKSQATATVAAGIAMAWAAGCGGPQSQTQGAIDVPEVAASDAAPAHGWAGTWRTSRGTLDLVQDGTRILGSFAYSEAGQERMGILIGTPKGNRLEFKWSVQKGSGKGQGRFVLHADGSKFSGTFGNDLSCTDAGKWSGLRSDDTLLGY
ncbi:MAG: hypothetical protein FJ100_16130 [Deltaproteobacteria bacterium]|nr:hypothetical protein [Deltaproteobacteria bacterium]